MSLDPRTPIIVGVGQVKQKLPDYETAEVKNQVDLMVDATVAAANDAGTTTLLGALEHLYVIQGMWGYPDPGRIVADAVGASNAKTFLTAMGGNMPQATVSHAAELILAGDVDVVGVTGGEAVYSKNKLRAFDRKLPHVDTDLAPAPRYGADVAMSSQHEQHLGFDRPTTVYPMFESAVRANAGRTPAEHEVYISELWAGFNAVAVANPHAWTRTPMTAEEIRTPGPSNRMVGYPYTKSMNSNSFVDFGSTILVCSVAKAEALGIGRDRWVFPHAATDGHATYFFSERDDYFSSPAIRHTGRRALELAGVGIDDIGPIDLYSCFPSVVQVTMNELGIASDRTVTTTGGLQFFGGPMNNYVIHAIASTVDAVRATGERGFVHANGGYATKHACAVYGSEPPATPFRREDVQAAIDAYPTRTVDEKPEGTGTVEAVTVLHGREGREAGLLTAIMGDGRRALGRTNDPSTLTAMETTETIGLRVELSADGTAHLDS